MDHSNDKNVIPAAYHEQAPAYDRTVKLFDFFAWFGFNITGWRKKAVLKLGLKAGDTVVDLGCGTGLNFPWLQHSVGSRGSIIGVDLSEAMLTQARHTMVSNQWTNVQLVCADAARFNIPAGVNAVLSTFALTLIPDPARIVVNARGSLPPGGRLVVLDMAWPRILPLWGRHVLFFLKTYGVTREVLLQRPWEVVQGAMRTGLGEVDIKSYWFGFFYLASGTVR